MLEVMNINKSFRNKSVLKDISFSIGEGEIVALLGKSGGGKTTLLRCINALEKSDTGSIRIGGLMVCEETHGEMVYATNKVKRELRREIALVFQSYNLFPHLTVMENIVEAPVFAFGQSKELATQKGLDLLKMMDLADKANAYPCELSGGQKQRVAIARACAVDPKLLCFDEPTSALDPELTETIAGIIERITRGQGRSTMIVTHDIKFVERVADRVIFMDQGEILVDCSKEEFFKNEKREIRGFLSI